MTRTIFVGFFSFSCLFKGWRCGSWDLWVSVMVSSIVFWALCRSKNAGRHLVPFCKHPMMCKRFPEHCWGNKETNVPKAHGTVLRFQLWLSSNSSLNNQITGPTYVSPLSPACPGDKVKATLAWLMRLTTSQLPVTNLYSPFCAPLWPTWDDQMSVLLRAEGFQAVSFKI